MSDKGVLESSHGADLAAVEAFATIPLLDDERLERLRAMIPAAAFGAIIQSYIESDFFAGLGDSPAADDADFPGMVHDCKGTSANLGAARVRLIAEKLELALHTGDRGAIAWLLPALRQATRLTRQALASRIAGL